MRRRPGRPCSQPAIEVCFPPRPGARALRRFAMTNRRQSASRQDAQAAAEDLAITALGFITREPARVARCGESAEPRRVPARGPAGEPHFPLGVLDPLAADEPLLLAFAAENAIDPGEVIKARDTMAGRRWERDTP